MKRYLLIGLGGFFGAILRLAIKNNFLWHYNALFPIHTLIVNIAGCFLIAWFLTLCTEVLRIDSDIRLCIATGFIGAFTTFSTLCKEAVLMLQHGHAASALLYLLISVVLGFLALYGGTRTARIKTR